VTVLAGLIHICAREAVLLVRAVAATVAAEGPAAQGLGLEQVLRAVLRGGSHRTQG
jgi:hypothetical protein